MEYLAHYTRVTGPSEYEIMFNCTSDEQQVHVYHSLLILELHREIKIDRSIDTCPLQQTVLKGAKRHTEDTVLALTTCVFCSAPSYTHKASCLLVLALTTLGGMVGVYVKRSPLTKVTPGSIPGRGHM